MPVLIITPDMRAETCDGAAGCALGSQMCRGIIPALMPNPISAGRKIAFFASGDAGSCPLAISSNVERPRLAWYISRNEKMIKAVPAWVMMKYREPALMFAGSRCS